MGSLQGYMGNKKHEVILNLERSKSETFRGYKDQLKEVIPSTKEKKPEDFVKDDKDNYKDLK